MNNVGREVARKLNRTAIEVRQAQRPAVQSAALVLTTDVRREIEQATGDSRLSGVGRGGARVGAGFDVKGVNNPTALVKARGPLQLVERPTKAHEIAPRRRRARGGRAAVRLADGSFRRAIFHPGTRGKYPFRKGIEKGRDKALRILRSSFGDAVKRGIRG